jgi:hypothetical protein
MLGPFICESRLANDIYLQFLQNELSYLLDDVLLETKCVCIISRMEHLILAMQWTLMVITRRQPPRLSFVGYLVYQERV